MKDPSNPLHGSQPPLQLAAIRSYVPKIKLFPSVSGELSAAGHLQIVRSSILAHHTEVDNLPRSPDPLGDSAVAIFVRVSLASPETETVLGQFSLTASRYLLSPTRSRYLRQNGNDPKFFVIVRSNDFAV